ncbi:MAG: hypothetical protein JF597_03305 [Streptomyces sp.]|uniref:hypothetical protein n=1 Tax=Streptomyces sp. TaxID=1931 RepID=UPI0025F16E5D|nr:hypothetical protein [Streptomyces sp.]MBW8792639.1 hypothetical protein [Streptomyces sp.]
MSPQPIPTTAPASEWPVGLSRYDRRGLLTEAEAAALRDFGIDQVRHHGLAAELVSLRPARTAGPAAG